MVFNIKNKQKQNLIDSSVTHVSGVKVLHLSHPTKRPEFRVIKLMLMRNTFPNSQQRALSLRTPQRVFEALLLTESPLIEPKVGVSAPRGSSDNLLTAILSADFPHTDSKSIAFRESLTM